MCPLCVGSALLALTGAGSASGLALIGARVLGLGAGKKTLEEPDGALDSGPRTEKSAADRPPLFQ
jgi:hypothetical protein